MTTGGRSRALQLPAALAVWLAPAAALAGGPDPLPEQPAGGEPIEISQIELESLLDLEVSAATKQPVKISDLPSTASAVTRDQLLDRGWETINDLLYTLPGFGPSQDYERRLHSFRGGSEGWNSNHLLLAIDGMPHINVETGGASTWGSAPLFFARKVEVVRGPASAVQWLERHARRRRGGDAGCRRSRRRRHPGARARRLRDLHDRRGRGPEGKLGRRRHRAQRPSQRG